MEIGYKTCSCTHLHELFVPTNGLDGGGGGWSKATIFWAKDDTFFAYDFNTIFRYDYRRKIVQKNCGQNAVWPWPYPECIAEEFS